MRSDRPGRRGGGGGSRPRRRATEDGDYRPAGHRRTGELLEGQSAIKNDRFYNPSAGN